MEQWLARWAHNPKAGGSNPSPATISLLAGGPIGWQAGTRRGIEQWLARRAHNPEVAGSNPVPATSPLYKDASYRFQSDTRHLYIEAKRPYYSNPYMWLL